VYPALLPLMRTPRLPVVDGTDAPADLNGLVRFGERRNLGSARVPSRFKRSLAIVYGSGGFMEVPSHPWLCVSWRQAICSLNYVKTQSVPRSKHTPSLL